MASEVKVPTLGESVSEATIGQWLKQPGETVAADEPIASLETDKVAVEVNAPAAGVLLAHLAKEGDTVSVGTPIATIEEGAVAPARPATRAESPAPARDAGDDGEAAVLSPAVRRAVLEHGIDPATVKGTGKDGRLTKEDVIAAAAAKPAAPAPVAASAEAAPRRTEERVRMTRLRQTIARRLKEAQDTAAMLTTFNDVDMSGVIAARDRYKDLFEKKHGVRLGFMSFFAKAACLALRDVPAVNARIENDEIVYHRYVDISVAVSAPAGLVTPVVRDADAMSFADIEKAIAEYGKRAREGALTLADLQGGTFTISNGGVFGSLMSTPIINPPQSAVLGLHRIEERPVVRDGQIVAR
ncbi:MAG: 2-oxoglutarate dehydrogenase complex dihydrolipoyllysine-residue succinyltransferase, partial [Sphingomonadales bacterium]|nr:2-oxoglutarate dehydrogenase complex dihydrolipoyllysine-residue succinyltransferase [Sphingomonadales bacterium]